MFLESLKKLFRRNGGNFILIAIGAALFVTITIVSVRYDNKAALTQQDLEKEFAQIQHLLEATPIRHCFYSTHKSHQALVSNQYKTTLSYPEIRAYYDSELAKHGWKFQREKGVLIWGQNYGGKEAIYSKGQYTASLYYAGDDPSARNWTYSLSISWGL